MSNKPLKRSDQRALENELRAKAARRSRRTEEVWLVYDKDDFPSEHLGFGTDKMPSEMVPCTMVYRLVEFLLKYT